MATPLALVGLGKIARDQHLPALAASPDFDLVATVSRSGAVPGVPNFPDIKSFLRGGPDAAVSLCAPPGPRTAQALAALAAGRDVMLEKPPAATLGEIEALRDAAGRAGRTLFATWHSRFAPGVAPARDWLAERRITGGRITWKEDVRRWHPRQGWIWEPGGFGVFDPGINALSILTALTRAPVTLAAAELTFPSNRAQPIAAELDLRLGAAPVAATFDWRQEGPQTWDIVLGTDAGELCLGAGGAELHLAGEAVALPPEAEYPGLYTRFAALLAAGESEVDAAPLRLVADAFLLGRRREAEPFDE